MIQQNANKGNDDIDELTNEELRNKILEINNDQLYKIGYMSYYFFISKSGELMRFINQNNFGDKMKKSKEKEILIKNFKILTDLFKTLEDDYVEQQVEGQVETLLKARRELYDLSQSLYAYEIELSYSKELIDHYKMNIIMEKEYKNIQLNKQDIQLLTNKINKMLDSSIEDDSGFINIVSNILRIMPFKMSKLKYFSLIKENLIAKFDQYPIEIIEYQIKEYKKVFNSSLMGDYGITFENYFTSIQKIKKQNIEKLTLNQLETIDKDIVELINEMNELKDFINTMGIITNRLILMISIKNKINFKEGTRNILTKWEELEHNVNEDLLKLVILESDKKLEEIQRQLLKDMKYFQDINNAGVERKGFFDEKLDKEVLFAKQILKYYNDIKFTKHEILFLENTEIVKKDYLEQLVENLIQYINRSIGTMQNAERKLRMRRFLCHLELPFSNVKEFISYIEYSLDYRVASKEEILFTIDSANYWLDGISKEN